MGQPNAENARGSRGDPAACLFSSTTIIDNGGPGLGDQGTCGQLCNCNSNCLNPNLVCSAWTGPTAADLLNYFGMKGYCSDPKLSNGGTDPGISICN